MARQIAVTNLMNAKMKPSDSVKDHMLKLMGFFAEAKDIGAHIDFKTQVEIVLNSLSKEFAGFRAAYNLGKQVSNLTQLMKELRTYELMIKGPIGEANLAVANSSPKGKKRKRQAKNSSSSSVRPNKKKMKKKKDLSKIKCYFCNKK